MPRIKIEGAGLGALIRNTLNDAPPSVGAPAPETVARLEEIEAARSAAVERLRLAEEAMARLKQASEANEASLVTLEESRRDGATRLAEATARLESVTRERDYLRRTIDTELPQGEAKELLVATLFDKGAEHEGRNNLLDAFHLYRRVLRLDPGHVEALLKVATIYYNTRLLLPAIEALRGVVELAPSRKKVAQQLAMVEEMARRQGMREGKR